MNWCIYLIAVKRRRTYVGSTTDVARRVRQHNREIVGGARSTAWGAPHWQLVIAIKGFSSRGEALRWESLVKKRARGLQPRIRAMMDVLEGKCPAPRSKTGKIYDVPTGLTIRVLG